MLCSGAVSSWGVISTRRKRAYWRLSCAWLRKRLRAVLNWWSRTGLSRRTMRSWANELIRFSQFWTQSLISTNHARNTFNPNKETRTRPSSPTSKRLHKWLSTTKRGNSPPRSSSQLDLSFSRTRVTPNFWCKSAKSIPSWCLSFLQSRCFTNWFSKLTSSRHQTTSGCIWIRRSDAAWKAFSTTRTRRSTRHTVRSKSTVRRLGTRACASIRSSTRKRRFSI